LHRDRKAVAAFLFSLGVLEGRVFRLFRRISEKVESPLVRFSLLYLAFDNLKNSVILEELSRSLAISKVKTTDYERVLGEVWEIVEALSKESLKIERFTKEKLLSLADKLAVIYTVTLVQLKTLRFMSKEISETYDVDLETIKGILELVIEDEETDTQLLMAIKNLSAEREETMFIAAPVTKYANPDSWYKSTPNTGQ
jgi:hypothetical protein